MNKPTEIDLKDVLAWGSISYALGFLTITLHTFLYGFPVIELLQAVYIWIGAPLAIIGFFSKQIIGFFRNQASESRSQIQESWEQFRGVLNAKDLNLVTDLLAILGAFFQGNDPLTKWLRSQIEQVLRRACDNTNPAVQQTAAKVLRSIGNILNVVNGLVSLVGLFMFAAYFVLMIYLYIWVIYPIIPQSLGGGAPSTIQLVVNTEKIPLYKSGVVAKTLRSAGEKTIKFSNSVISDPVDLLYVSKDQYYLKGKNGVIISISKNAVEAVVWPAKKIAVKESDDAPNNKVNGKK